MDHYWLLTSTFYGNWLPGDRRGFVGRVRDRRPDDPDTPSRVEHNQPDTPYDPDIPELRRRAMANMNGEPIRVTAEQAEVLVTQFRETAGFRGWELLAAAVMSNHVHLVVRVPGFVDAAKLLGDFKAYGSRALNSGWGKPPNGTWWTYHGSTRVLPDGRAVTAAVRYVERQPGALVVWTSSGVASAPRDTADESEPEPEPGSAADIRTAGR
jgi:REP element-mobilizing transposase RayT